MICHAIPDYSFRKDFLNGTHYATFPPVDGIGEIKVETANYIAELGRAGGAALNALLKSVFG